MHDNSASVTQLDRVPVYEIGCRRFDSCQALSCYNEFMISKADIRKVLGDAGQSFVDEVMTRLDDYFDAEDERTIEIKDTDRVWIVVTVADADRGRAALERFDQEWWIDNTHRTAGQLQVTIHHS